MKAENQFLLLNKRRFLPFFLTQSLGALNDNIYKNALLITITFSSADELFFSVGILANIASILFILPFFLFSPLFGQLADKYEKSKSIRYIKISEVIIILLAILALQVGNIYLLLAILFLLGVQSAAFGPIKYSILPQHLSRTELTGGNGLVETGTFLAILLGTLLGGVLVSQYSEYSFLLPTVLLAIAIAGYFASQHIPQSAACESQLKINWNPFTQIYKTYTYVSEQKAVLQSVFGISWFWFYGSVLLTQLPNYTRTTLGADETVTTIVLMAFSIGVGAGSMFCNKLSNGRIEPGLVPIGAFGLSLFTLHLFFANQNTGLEPVLGATDFLSAPVNLRILFDISMIGFFGGIYVVPLYAMIQNRANPNRLSRIISGSNILDALFIVLSGVFAISLISLGQTVPQIFLTAAILNILVAAYIFKQVPEFIMRTMAWLCTRTWFQLQHEDLSNIPEEGACILHSNSARFTKALILAGRLKRNAHFVFIRPDSPRSLLSSLFKLSGSAILPIDAKFDLMALKKEIKTSIEKDSILCVFHAFDANAKSGEIRDELESYLSSLGCPKIAIDISSISKNDELEENPDPALPNMLSGKIRLQSAKPVKAGSFELGTS